MDTCNRLDRLPACDRQTDGRTSCHDIVRAMHTRRAVTIDELYLDVSRMRRHLVETRRQFAD